MKRRFLSIVLSLALACVCLACGGKETVYPKVERPEIETPEVMGGYLTPPEKPAAAPTVDPEGTIGFGEAEAVGAYTIGADTDGNLTIAWEEVESWDYVWLPIENYDKSLSNFKLTVDGAGAENLTVAAVYYEMYDAGEHPVVLWNGHLTDGEQYVVCEFGEARLLGKTYDPITGEQTLKDRTVLGVMLLLDSNPVQSAPSDYAGAVTIKDIKFLPDGDKELEDRYVVPTLNTNTVEAVNATTDPSYTVTFDDETGKVNVTYEASGLNERVYLPILNASKDYCEFTISFTTQNVQSYSIAVLYAAPSDAWQPYNELVRIDDVSDGTHTHTLNYDGVAPISTSTWTNVPGEYIKNYNVYQICLWFDSLNSWDAEGHEVQEEWVGTDGTVSIDSLEFARTATEGCVVSKSWNAGTPEIVVGDDVQIGGIGTVTYSYYTAWYALTIPVMGYVPNTHLTIKFMADVKPDHLGVGILWPKGEYSGASTVYAAAAVFGEGEGVSEAADSGYASGVKYTVSKDADGVWTMEFDLSGAREDKDGVTLWNNTITGLLFYFNDSDNAHPFEGTREIKFVSIAFSE